MKQILLVLAALALVGSACSTDVASVSNDSASVAPAQVSQDSAESLETEADPDTAKVVAVAAESEQAAEPEQVDAPVDFNGDGSGDWCDIFGVFAAQAEVVDDRYLSDDPQQVEAYYRDQSERLLVLLRAAPPELASDIGFIAEVNSGFFDAFEAAEWDLLAADPNAVNVDDVAYAQAFMNIENYNFEVCGIERAATVGSE